MPNPPPSSGARSAFSTSTRTCATARRWRSCGEADALWEALQVVNPVTVTEIVAQRLAAPAQRLLQQQRLRLSRPLSGERRVVPSEGRHGGGRRRLAHLLERSGPLHPTCSSPTLSASGGVSASVSSIRCCRARSGASRSKETWTAARTGGTCRADRRQTDRSGSRCGLRKSSRRRPSRISGQLMKSSQIRPVR